jgi:integrase/recombinase XerD
MVRPRKLGIRTKAARALPSRSRQGRAGPGPGIRKASLPSPDGLRLHTANGARKYITAGEREAFLREAERAERLVRTLCMTLAYAGCRLSEALATHCRPRGPRRRRVGVRDPEEAPGGNLPRRARPPCPARCARPGARHPRAARPLWRQPASMAHRPRPKGCATVSALPPSPPASLSTLSRNGSDTPSSPPPPSMPMPRAPRKRTSSAGCGDKRHSPILLPILP